MLVLNLPFKALMFLTLMRPSLVLFLVLWLKLVKDFLKVRCRLALLPFLISCLIWLDLVASLPLDRKSGSAGMPRPTSYAVFCLKKKREGVNPDGYCLDKLEPIPSALPSFQKLFQVSATTLSIPLKISTTPEAASVTTLEISFAVAPI